MADILLSLGVDTTQLQAQLGGVARQVQHGGLAAVAIPGAPLVEKQIEGQTKAVSRSTTAYEK